MKRATICCLLVSISLFLSSCTPAFNVRIYNRSDHEITVSWRDWYGTVIPAGKSKFAGSGRDYQDAKDVAVRIEDRELQYEVVGNLSRLPTAAIRALHFPAARGGRECCLDFGDDDRFYVLDAKSLSRLTPQPAGFPMAPRSEKRQPNQSVESYAGMPLQAFGMSTTFARRLPGVSQP